MIDERYYWSFETKDEARQFLLNKGLPVEVLNEFEWKFIFHDGGGDFAIETHHVNEILEEIDYDDA